jgi:protein-disulfide isomerase
MRPNVLALALACSLSIAGCSRAAEQEDKAFGDKVRAYLLAHPEVIKEAADKYNADLDARFAAEARANIGKNRAAIERDSRDFVANPNGKITVTEFYDYRCPHCVNVAPKVLSFITKNPDVRFVFKEMPIFGETSERAALAALAVKNAGGDYLGAHRDMMAARPLDAAAIDRILKAHNVDPAVLQQPAVIKAGAAQLADIHKLSTEIGIEGTPAFIIGDTLVPGEDMDAVEQAVAAERKKG